ncbi:uroporphyrinogen-III synthase [Macrococcus equipercicus]|nr:uroporphyrinogen-III synthase [Macrococcus equipercicus]UTH13080.1 uroporphyrinogen-III synthase [Macrococcus equipercicus]
MKPVILMTDSHATKSDKVDIVHLPLIGIRQLPVVHAYARNQYDWLLFTSRNAVRLFFEQYPDITFSKVASIGSRTSEALITHGVAIDYEPPEFNQESFIAHAADRFDDCSILLPCSAKARPKLADFLSRRAAVTTIALYEPVTNENNAKKMNTLLLSGSIDVVVFMSPSAVRAYFTAYSKIHQLVVAIGPVTSRALQNVHQPHITALQSTKEAIIDKILEMRDSNAI